jgi:hypothetical protein
VVSGPIGLKRLPAGSSKALQERVKRTVYLVGRFLLNPMANARQNQLPAKICAGDGRWAGQSFCRTSEALRRVCRKHVGTIDPVAATLAALPEWIEERAAAAEAPDRIGGAAE